MESRYPLSAILIKIVRPEKCRGAARNNAGSTVNAGTADITAIAGNGKHGAPNAEHKTRSGFLSPSANSRYLMY
jgi:hypothetical protein